MFEELRDILYKMETDLKAGEKGNKAAATRARKHLTLLKDKAQELRMKLVAIKKGEA